MRHTKQARVLVPLLALALGAAACSDDGEPTAETPTNTASSGTSTSEPKVGGTLRVLSQDDFAHYDTAPAYDTNSYHLLRATDRQLFTNASGDPETRFPMQPDLAAGLPEISPDGRTYTVTLKDGVQWNTSPARQITTADVIRGLKFVCNPDDPFGSTGYFTDLVAGMADFCSGFEDVETGSAAATRSYVEGNQISGLQAVDDKTLRITLTQPAGDFIHILALPTASPRPVEALAYIADSPQYRDNKIESGPYQVESYEVDKSLVLTRNPAWKKETDTIRPANVDRMEFTFGVPNDSIQQQIDAGTADVAAGNTAPSAAALSQLEEGDPQLFFNSTGSQNPYLVFNTQGGKPSLRDVRVRQAFAYAVNKRNLVQDAGGTRVAKPSTQIFPESVIGAGYVPQDLYATENFAGDPDRARGLLTEAGVTNPSFVLAHRSNGNNPRYAQTLQADLAKAGITVTLMPMTPDIFYTTFLPKTAVAKAGRWDVALPGWGPDWEGASQRSFYTPLLNGRVYRDGSNNFGNYNDDAVNTAADAALQETDPAEAARQWLEVDRMVMEDLPWVPLVEQTQANYVASRVGGFAYYFAASSGDLTSYFIK